MEQQILLSAEYELVFCFFFPPSHLRVIIIIEILQQCMLSYRFDASADVEKQRIMWKHVADSDLSFRVKVLFCIKPRFLHS